MKFAQLLWSSALLLPCALGQPHASSALGGSARPFETPFARVQRDLEDMVAEGQALAVEASVQVGDKLIFQGRAGWRDAEGGDELAEGAIFRIFSMTKPITAVAALTFLDEGLLALDDPVSKFLPALADVKVKGRRKQPDQALERPILILDLFRHSAGWDEATPWQRVARERGASHANLEQLVDALSSLPLKCQPGTRWEYSIAHDVLGRVIEVLAEKPLDEVFLERIFEPLEMLDTGFQVPEGDLDRVVALFVEQGGELVPVPPGEVPDPAQPPAWFAGGHGLFSTSADFLRFTAMLRGGGKLGDERILNPETVKLMLRDHTAGLKIRGSALMGRGYGLGVAVHTNRSWGLSPGSWGWSGAAGTMFFVDPEVELTMLFMNQNWLDFESPWRFAKKAGKALEELAGK
jgi:CubicO group peptidase (beta-lactamase class C family)